MTTVDTERVRQVLDLYTMGNIGEAHQLLEKCTVDELVYLCEKIDRALKYARN